MEIWEDIQGFEGSYRVSTLGNILSLPKKRVKKPTLLNPYLKRGHQMVCLVSDTYSSRGIKKYAFSVAKLVVIHFNDTYKDYFDKSLICKYKDGNPLNCKLSNITPRAPFGSGGAFARFSRDDKWRVSMLFWRTELRIGEKIIDNTTSAIARETGLSRDGVHMYINYMLDNKYKNFKI